MKRFWIRRGLRFLVFALLFIGLAGLAVMTLWNALLPTILGVSAINFWQALGLLVLSRILFGGFGRGGPRMGGPRTGGWGQGGRNWRGGYGPIRAEWKQKMTARWQNMTPEQREQMKQQWRDKCGGSRRSRDQRGRGTQPEQPNSGEPPTTTL